MAEELPSIPYGNGERRQRVLTALDLAGPSTVVELGARLGIGGLGLYELAQDVRALQDLGKVQGLPADTLKFDVSEVWRILNSSKISRARENDSPFTDVAREEARPGFICLLPQPADGQVAEWFASLDPEQRGRRRSSAWRLDPPLKTARWIEPRILEGPPASMAVSPMLWRRDEFFVIAVAAVHFWGRCLERVLMHNHYRVLVERLELAGIVVANRSRLDPLGRMADGLREWHGVPVLEIPGRHVADFEDELLAAARSLGFENVSA